MKRFLLTLLTVAIVAALAVYALAPAIIRQYRLREDGKTAAGYRAAVNGLDPSDCDVLLAQAWDYNQARGSVPWSDPYGSGAEEGDDYAALLNPAGNGVMGILSLPKLGVALAVYHGGEAEASAGRVEHAPGSRLPADGADGPCVLRARRERFFDPLAHLDRLMVGDCFFLRVLQDTATYQVFQVATMPPQALAGLESIDGDECALVAETAAGDRLVVRGRRVPRRSATPVDDSIPLPDGVPQLIYAAPVAAAGLAMLAIVEFIRRAIRRLRRRRMKL